MQVEISELDYCKVGIIYHADAEDVKAKRQWVAKEMSKTWEVPGFRKGKASAEVVRITYPKEVEGHLKQEMLTKAYEDSLVEKNIRPFGGPQVISTSLDGNDFKAEFSVHTLPEFELKEYKGFEIPKASLEMTEEELTQKILQETRIQHAESVPYAEGDFIQQGDKVVMQYKGFLDGEELTDLSSEGTLLEVGKINLPGFDEQILGMKPDEERKFTLHTPTDFSDKYGDKDLELSVKLMTGSKVVPAALDDDLAKKMGTIDYATLEQEARVAAASRIQAIENSHYQDQVAKRLIAEHDFKVPEWISGPEAQVQAKMRKNNWDEMSDDDKASLVKESEEAIKLSLVIAKIQENEPNAQLTEEELIETAKKNISQFTTNAEQAMSELQSKGQLGALLTRVKDEHALNYIISQSKIVE